MVAGRLMIAERISTAFRPDGPTQLVLPLSGGSGSDFVAADIRGGAHVGGSEAACRRPYPSRRWDGAPREPLALQVASVHRHSRRWRYVETSIN